MRKGEPLPTRECEAGYGPVLESIQEREHKDPFQESLK